MSATDAELDFEPEVVNVGDELPSPPPPVAPPVEGYTPPSEPEPETEAISPAEPKSEMDRLLPGTTEMVLVSGLEFELEEMRLRQFLRLLRIITRGASDVLDTASLDFENPDVFVQQFMGMLLFSIPEAENEAVDFIKSMVRPKGLVGDPKKDMPKVQELLGELENPDLNDVITITQCVVENEGEDLRKLGKRLGSMLKVAEKMGATKPGA